MTKYCTIDLKLYDEGEDERVRLIKFVTELPSLFSPTPIASYKIALAAINEWRMDKALDRGYESAGSFKWQEIHQSRTREDKEEFCCRVPAT